MPERDSILRVTGGTVLTLVAAACTVGLAGVLRRDRRLVRGSGVGPRSHRKPPREPRPESEPARDVPGPQEVWALRTIPHQRRTGPSVEQVLLTQAEREAFATLVRRFTGGREAG
ncbi:hypothetical protein [Streptomyces sp. NEAU-W12]|uniref:hypothetical protein n=1 Tax=Streptomyces sp. NEAU-W12 TaxID=2994668 RepID=UPI00224B94A2|nr:hypothetical protein [Streptomyces sp. NEAU-W12]MCX2926620.1 hypothetical protein [Streptomyces sp. NEAU-W12]